MIGSSSIVRAGAGRARGPCTIAALLVAGGACFLAAAGCDCRSDRDGAPPGDLTAFYALDVLPEFHIELDAAARARLADEPREWVRGTFRHDGVEYPGVGVRLKGHRSMRDLDDKPAFKLRFDKYRDDGQFLGHERLTLNNMVEDPTMLREVLGYRLYREAGVAAPNAAYAAVYLDGEYKGLYAIVETIDKGFLARRFGDPGGDLYEGEYGCDLYPDDVAGFDHERGPDDDRDNLAALAARAAGSPDRLFGPESPLDMDGFMAYLAVSAFIGDFDGYRHSHNYRIYHRPDVNRWTFLPWGIDRVFKKHISIYDSEGLLAKRCFADAPCRLRYLRTMREVLAHFEKLDLDQGVAVVSAFIDERARQDRHKPYSDAEVAEQRARLLAYLRDRPDRVRAELACLADDGGELDRDRDGSGCTDCDDGDAAVHPGAAEACDGVDNDCSGLADDHPACPCPVRDIGGTVFHFCNRPMTWAEAAAFCAAQGTELARITDADQSRAVYRAAREHSRERWWIGLSDRRDEGTFAWTDGEPGSFTHWARGEPDNDGCNQDCAALKEDGGGRWHDTHCAQMRPFVCAARAAASP